MKNTIRRVGAVEGRPRTKNHLHPLQIFISGWDEVEEVHPKRGNASQAMVRQGVEGAGEDVVESPDHHVTGLDPVCNDVHTRGRTKMLYWGERHALLNFHHTHEVGRGWSVDQFLGLAPGGRVYEGIQRKGGGFQLDADGGRLSSKYIHPVLAGGHVTQILHNDRVGSGWKGETVHPVRIRQRAGGVSTANHLYLRPFQRLPCLLVSHNPRQRPVLGRQRCGAQKEEGRH